MIAKGFPIVGKYEILVAVRHFCRPPYYIPDRLDSKTLEPTILDPLTVRPCSQGLGFRI